MAGYQLIFYFHRGTLLEDHNTPIDVHLFVGVFDSCNNNEAIISYN
ncbi:MAG: hypothetical protein FWH54_01455 [Methanobrevibacter sp.]|nr:hypothetical protein [Methanobrevibacter sp.]